MICLDYRRLGALLASILLVWSCAPQGARPFMMVQLCLVDQEGVNDFLGIIQSIESYEHLRFRDSGRDVQERMKRIDPEGMGTHYFEPTIYISLLDPSGMGLIASNMGLSTYEVGIGFSEGERPREAREFADMVVAALGERWTVETVPPGTGALPMEGCSQ